MAPVCLLFMTHVHHYLICYVSLYFSAQEVQYKYYGTFHSEEAKRAEWPGGHHRMANQQPEK